MSLCSAPSQGLWCVCDADKKLFLWLGTEARNRLCYPILTATSVFTFITGAEQEEEPGFSSSVGKGW